MNQLVPLSRSGAPSVLIRHLPEHDCFVFRFPRRWLRRLLVAAGLLLLSVIVIVIAMIIDRQFRFDALTFIERWRVPVSTLVLQRELDHCRPDRKATDDKWALCVKDPQLSKQLAESCRRDIAQLKERLRMMERSRSGQTLNQP